MGWGLECVEDREYLTGQGYSALRNGFYGCGQSSQSPTGGRGGWQPWFIYVPALESVHLLDMYVLLIESLIIVPNRCLQCTLVVQMVHTLFKDLSLNLNDGYCLCCEVCACYIHFL